MKKSHTAVRYSGIQPQYFPRLHYFARILHADVFVIRDDCQYVNSHKYPDGSRGKSYQSHSPIRQPQGIYLLTVPIVHDGLQRLSKTKIQNTSPWGVNHSKTIKNFYGKAPNFSKIYPELEIVLSTKYEHIADLTIATVCWGILHILNEPISKDALTIDYVEKILAKNNSFRLKHIKKGSEFITEQEDQTLSPNEKIVKICKTVGASEDYSGGTAVEAYVDHSLFEKNGIKLTVQDWQGKEYNQQFMKQQPFIKNLSIIDLLMNVSPQEVVSIIRG